MKPMTSQFKKFEVRANKPGFHKGDIITINEHQYKYKNQLKRAYLKESLNNLCKILILQILSSKRVKLCCMFQQVMACTL